MKVATITEAKNRLSALLDQVREGETVLIVDRGIPVARLESVVSLEGDSDGRLARLRRVGAVEVGEESPPVELPQSPPPRPRNGASGVQTLLDERRRSR